MSKPVLGDYLAWLERVKANGGRVLPVTMPCCGQPLELRVPASWHEEWDSAMTCAHCGAMWFGVYRRDSVELAQPGEIYHKFEAPRRLIKARSQVAP